MVNTRAAKATNVDFKTSGDGVTIVKIGNAPVGQITERTDGEFDYSAFDDRTIDGHFVTYEDAEAFVRVALGSDESSNGPGEVPGIIKDMQKPRRSPKVVDVKAEREKAKERERVKKEKEKEAERKRKEREKLSAQKKKEREEAAALKAKEREAERERKKAEREAAKVVKLDGLVPTKMRGRAKLVVVPIDQIDDIDVGTPVDRDLIESVRVHGILQPPTLRQMENGRFVPVMGRRRIQAARANGLTSVEAIVESRSGEVVNDEIMLLIENTNRSENVIAQFKAAQSLVDKGFSVKQIAAATQTEGRVINKLLRLSRLHPRLIEATEDGLMSPWSADHMARKDMGEQEAAVRELDESGKVSTEFVKALGKVRKDGAVASLADRFKLTDLIPDESIDEVSRDTVERVPADGQSRRQFASGHLKMAYAALIAAGEDGVAGLVQSALEAMEAAASIA